MNGDCSREIKTLAPWKKSNDRPRECIEKQRHHFSDKGPYSQSCGFSSIHVWMWELDYKECWVPKNWCFWTGIVMLEKTLEKWSNQSILKEINPEYSFEGLMLKLKLQYFGHLMWRANSLEKTLMLGKIEGKRRRGLWDDWMASRTQWTWVWASSRRWWTIGKSGVLQSMGLQRVTHNWVTEQQNSNNRWWLWSYYSNTVYATVKM